MPGAVAPARLVCSKCAKNAHGQSTGTTEHTPAFPAQWFTAYTWSPRSAGLFSLRPPGLVTRRLAPASGRRDRTISLVRQECFRRRAIHALSILTSTASHVLRP